MKVKWDAQTVFGFHSENPTDKEKSLKVLQQIIGISYSLWTQPLIGHPAVQKVISKPHSASNVGF